MMNRHLIRTQVLAVTTTSAANAFPLQQQLSELFYSTILPAIETAFDELSPAENRIQIDTLEVNLGTISLADIESGATSGRLKQILTNQVKQYIASVGHERAIRRVADGAAEQWIYYMEHGILPWNLRETSAHWYEQVLSVFATDSTAIASLRNLISTDSRALKRIILTHDTTFIVHLLEVLTARRHGGLPDRIAALAEIVDTLRLTEPDAAHSTKRKIWMQSLSYAAHDAREISTDDIVLHLVAVNVTEKDLPVFTSHLLSYPLLRGYQSEIVRRRKEARESLQSVRPQKDTPDESRANRRSILEEGSFVCHAGLVIIHPFLTNLFAYTGLTDNQKFVSEEAWMKALKILHYLATGKRDVEEHELIVPKLLCGYELEEPADPAITLTAPEEKECDDLLREVIARWSILKNTSPDGLRVNFLQRSGKLDILAGRPRLVVESNTLDVLLDHLPWSVGVIKLPWMQKHIVVDWR